MTIGVGTVLGRYEILGVIGRGNMGAVYEARDPKIERQVAIKTISLIGQDATEEREFRERLFQEARAAGRLVHPGIVTIFDVGEDPDSHDPFIVMEYVAGQSLDRLIESSPTKKLPLASALQLVREIAEALDCAHKQGVIHRDIKPANILITKDGRAKIADFGIAKLNQASLTLPGHLIGSPAYMAPEQLAGEEADGRADLFALGVIFYAMLTGHRPFQGNSAATVAFKLMNRPPVAVTTFEADLPRELDDMVFRAIAKDPDERYQSGAEFAFAVRQLQENYGPLSTSIGVYENQPVAHRDLTPPKRNAVPKQAPIPWHKKLHTKLIWWGTFLIAGVFFLWFVIRPFSKAHQTAKMQSVESTPAQSALPAPPIAETAPKQNTALHIEIEFHFPAGQATIWLAGKPIFSQALKGVRSKRALVFHESKGSLVQDLQVKPGRHDLRIRIKSSTGNYDQTKTVAANFVEGKGATLHILCEGHELKVDLH